MIPWLLLSRVGAAIGASCGGFGSEAEEVTTMPETPAPPTPPPVATVCRAGGGGGRTCRSPFTRMGASDPSKSGRLHWNILTALWTTTSSEVASVIIDLRNGEAKSLGFKRLYYAFHHQTLCTKNGNQCASADSDIRFFIHKKAQQKVCIHLKIKALLYHLRKQEEIFSLI